MSNFFRKYLKLKNTLKIVSILLISCSIEVYGNNFKNLNTSFNKVNKIEKKELKIISNYIVDSGDILFINFSGIDVYSREYIVDLEGNIFLPEIYNFNVRNKTLNEIKQELTLRYKEYIIDPEINILITTYRPITVFINGEVNKPGLYTLTTPSMNKGTEEENKPGVYNLKNYPKLFDALKIVGGVNNYADLTKVEIVRNNSKNQGGGRIKTTINFLELILNGDQSGNIRLHDGDTIKVYKSDQLIKDQILAINKTNLTPLKLTVYITGNVVKPGLITLNKGSSLVQAIASSGGKKLMTGDVEFTRFNGDGSTIKNKFKFNPNAKLNSPQNPILMDGDVINVNKTILGKTTEILNDVSSPFLKVLGIYELLD